MLFNSLEYAVLLAAVFVAYWSLAKLNVLRLLALLLASYLFYAWWSPYYLILIILSSTLDYFVGGMLHRSEAPGRRKLLLVISLVGNLGLLAAFKYFNFFVDSIGLAAGHLDLSGPTRPKTPPEGYVAGDILRNHEQDLVGVVLQRDGAAVVEENLHRTEVHGMNVVFDGVESHAKPG